MIGIPVPVVVHDCPDETYFRASQIRPWVEGETLHIVDGRGTHRSWGAPNVSSEVRKLHPDVIQVEVVGWHKHTVSPVGGTYYFVFEDERWTRRRHNYWRVREALEAKAQVEAAAPEWQGCGYPGCSPAYCDECDGAGSTW